jgi:hypothetical protein
LAKFTAPPRFVLGEQLSRRAVLRVIVEAALARQVSAA